MDQCLFSVLNHPDWNIKTSMYIIHGIIPLFSAVLYFDYILAEKIFGLMSIKWTPYKTQLLLSIVYLFYYVFLI